MSEKNNYADLGYCAVEKKEVLHEFSLSSLEKPTKPRIFVDQLPKKPYREPPDWVRIKLSYLKENMRKYKY